MDLHITWGIDKAGLVFFIKFNTQQDITTVSEGRVVSVRPLNWKLVRKRYMDLFIYFFDWYFMPVTTFFHIIRRWSAFTWEQTGECPAHNPRPFTGY